MNKNPPSMDFGPTTQQFEPAPMNDALPAGTRLGGYQLIQVLGRGGFGIVYLALDSSLQRQVAIKEFLPAEMAMRCDDGQVWVRPGADPRAYAAGMSAFLNEAKLLARFDHPALVRVLSYWEENRTAYMVMPFYEGQTLAAMLADMPRPPEEDWLRSLLAPLLSALSTLHNAQCLHLDISPSNIIVQADDRPVLLDFGVASRLAADKTMPLTALLNPAYAPIEQYSESPTLPQGPWTDLYALASVVHFAIAGVPPARATVRAVEDPQRPLVETVAARAEQFPGLSYSRSFLSAIDKALAVKPRARPRSAAELEFLLNLALPEGEDSLAGAAAAAAPSGASPSAASPSAPSPFNAPFSMEPSSGAASVQHSTYGPSESWFAAEPKDAPSRPTRSRMPLWLATVALLGAAGVGGYVWLQRQPSFANITSADLPPSVVASIPKPVADGASAVVAAPAASASAVASAVAPTASPAQAASAVAPLPAPPASTPSLAATSTAAHAPAASASRAASAPAVAAEKPTPAKTSTAKTKQPVKAVAAAPAAPPEPATPRAACGGRSNFALVYCMQQQCKRGKFSTHPQCLDTERRGEP